MEEKRQIVCYIMDSHKDESLICKHGKERWMVPGSHEGGLLLKKGQYIQDTARIRVEFSEVKWRAHKANKQTPYVYNECQQYSLEISGFTTNGAMTELAFIQIGA